MLASSSAGRAGRVGARSVVSVLRVACASGTEYAPHTAAMLHSVLEHAGDLRVEAHYLVSPRFPPSASGSISRMMRTGGGHVLFHEVSDHRLAELASRPRFDPAVWYPLLLADLVPDVDRVLYIDSDALAMDNLRPLWSTSLDGAWAAAVPNLLEPWNHERPAQLGLSGPREYLNSGVLLFDLATMRADDATERLLGYARRRGPSVSGLDQDALSVVMAGRWRELHVRWNTMNSVYLFDEAPGFYGAAATEEARRRPGIRHFEGPGLNKPWHFLCDRPGRQSYEHHRSATPWPRVRREGVTPANVVRKALARARR